MFEAQSAETDWEWAKRRRSLFKTPIVGAFTGVATFVAGMVIRGAVGDPNWFRTSLVAGVVAVAVALGLPQVETLLIWRRRHGIRLEEAKIRLAEMEAATLSGPEPLSRAPKQMDLSHMEAAQPDDVSHTSQPRDQDQGSSSTASQDRSTKLTREHTKRYDIRQSTAEFHARMADAFPGVSGLHAEGDAAAAKSRLGALLQTPLGDGRTTSPIWELGFGSSAVTRYQTGEDNVIYINHYRFRLSKLVGYRSDRYWRDFALFYWDADDPTGLYDVPSRQEMLESAGISGRYTEEYGLWNNQLITRQEYDDGSIFRNGRIQPADDARLEVRQLLPGVTFLVGQLSPINDLRNERARWEILEGHRRGSIDLKEIAAWIETLPLHSRQG